MTGSRRLPRLLIAGLSGSSGKTLISIGLTLLLRRAGLEVRTFKKGPDYIDTAWLSWASSHPARNLDTYLMGSAAVISSFAQHATEGGINLIEGSRGLFDGFDAAGTHSSGVLSQCLSAPVVLIVNGSKVTRTAAALVLGCQKLDPQVPIRAVILNEVSGPRHEQILRTAIESKCSIPVVGAITRCSENPLPERHLGLVPPKEYGAVMTIERKLVELVDSRIDLQALISVAQSAPPVQVVFDEPFPQTAPAASTVRVGYLTDSAFSFYYPDNLEALQRAGAVLVPISAFESHTLPNDLNALYIGGGFPETHAEALSANRSFLESIRQAALAGLPIYAECGGLILLANSLAWNESRHGMAGVFPFDVNVSPKPQGHGYTELLVDSPNPFFPIGLKIRGHEFHYSKISRGPEKLSTAGAVLRGAGCFEGRDFIVTRNVMASYTHLHAIATPEWAKGLVNAARSFVPRVVN